MYGPFLIASFDDLTKKQKEAKLTLKVRHANI